MNTTTPRNEKAAPLVALPVDLRDYFAAKALSKAIEIEMGVNGRGDITVDDACLIAEAAYVIADAMLRARIERDDLSRAIDTRRKT